MQNRPLGIGAVTAPSEKSVHLVGRQAIRPQEAQRNAELADPCERSPVNAIVEFAAPLLRDVEQMECDLRSGCITGIRNPPDLLGLIDDILDCSKLDAGRRDIRL